MSERQENMIWALAFMIAFLVIAVPRKYTPAAVVALGFAAYAVYWRLKDE